MMKFFRRFHDLGIRGNSARWYDRNSRKYRTAEMKQYAKEVAGYLEKGSSVLELAPGPGYLSIELAKLGSYRIIGIDISDDFVEIARRNAGEAGVQVEFKQGNASAIPAEKNQFDFIVCTAAFKNFREPAKVLSEMHRVLKEGGKALIIDMNRNASNRQMDEQVRESGLKGTQALFMQWTFKYFLKKGAYTKDEFLQMLSQTEFSGFEVKEEGIGLSVYLQK
jgi:ubiquinone/menaquinone biosynthesis C-methylase UbiE